MVTTKRKFIDIGSRLKLLRNDLSQNEMASRFDMTLRSYQRYESGERVPPMPVLGKIAKEYNTTVDWILTDVEDVEKARMIERNRQNWNVAELLDRIEESLQREEQLIYRYCDGRAVAEDKTFADQKEFVAWLHKWLDDRKLEDDFVFIPQVAGKISAGGGLAPDNTVEITIGFKKDWIARKGDPRQMSLIRVSGDSMEDTLFSGDLVLIDHNRTHVDPQGGIYAITVGDDIMLKRLHLLYPLQKVRIISDNKQYDPLEVSADDIIVNGKVIWFARDLER